MTYPYRDRETYEIHRTGDEVELTPERFAELSASRLRRRRSHRPDGGRAHLPEEPEGEDAEQAKAEADETAPDEVGAQAEPRKRRLREEMTAAADARRNRIDGRLRAEEGDEGSARRAFGAAVSERIRDPCGLRAEVWRGRRRRRGQGLRAPVGRVRHAARRPTSRGGARTARGVRPAHSTAPRCAVACAVVVAAPLTRRSAWRAPRSTARRRAATTRP